MLRLLLGCVFSVLFYLNANACRFTVREIGFSTLSQDIYALVVIDDQAVASDPAWQRIRNKLDDSNIKLLVLHPESDATHPYVREALNQQLSLPANLLIAPDGSMLELLTPDGKELPDVVLDSPIRKEMINDFVDVFSVVLWVEGKDDHINTEVEGFIQRDCDRIKNIMPHMPKEVRNGPKVIRISADAFEEEKLLLWSLGIEQAPEQPIAFVLYGRGRIMGGALMDTEIAEGKLFNYMSMIGADCECGLDRKWMLGNQIPMLWASGPRQHLANEVGFDVDNPMILAEMSRILAKETNPDIAGEVGFGIEVIDLNEAFGEAPEIIFDEKDPEVIFNPLVIVILTFTLSIVLIGVFLYYRNMKS